MSNESPSDQIPPERLMEAVDAIYAAQEELQLGALPGYPPDLLGSPIQPEAFVDFTSDEIAEATLFLSRMGLMRIWPFEQTGTASTALVDPDRARRA